MPIVIQIFPTVISLARGYDHNIFSLYHHNRFLELKKFVEKAIENYVTELTADEYAPVYGKNKQEIGVEKSEASKPEIMLITNKDRTPLSFKYGAFLVKIHYIF